MHKNLKDDLEAQRDVSLVIRLLSDTVRTADDLLHQVTIDGYHVSYTEIYGESSTDRLLEQTVYVILNWC